FCISEYIPGVTLQDLPSSDLTYLLVPTARTLEVIGSSNLENMSGFGPFEAQGVGPNNSWRDFLISIADPHRYDWVALGGRTPQEDVKRFLHRVQSLVEHCPEIRRVVHGDFGSNNVLTDGRRITGVID